MKGIPTEDLEEVFKLPVWVSIGYEVPRTAPGYEGVYDINRLTNLTGRIQDARNTINREYSKSLIATAKVTTSIKRRGLLGRDWYIEARLEAKDETFKDVLREFTNKGHAGRPSFVVDGNSKGLGLTKYVLQNEGIALERRASGLWRVRHLVTA